MYLGNGEVLRYEPDEDDLQSTERKVLALRDAIARAADAEAFAPDAVPALRLVQPPGPVPGLGRHSRRRSLPERADWPTSAARSRRGGPGVMADRQVNRRHWDERAPAHAASPDYGLARFVEDPRTSATWCASTSPGWAT